MAARGVSVSGACGGFEGLQVCWLSCFLLRFRASLELLLLPDALQLQSSWAGACGRLTFVHLLGSVWESRAAGTFGGT